MFHDVDVTNPKAVYLQIVDAVRRAIALGALAEGDRLPPIRQTAVQTRVNRNTVSRAYLELEHQGLVTARQGSGFYVTPEGADRERDARRSSLEQSVEELVVEARIAGTTTDELVRLIRECAEQLGHGTTIRPTKESEHV